MTSRKSRLAPSKHHLQTSNDPPSELRASQKIARIVKLHGNSLYTVELPLKTELLVELPSRFRNAVWVRRGGYVVVETEGFIEGKVNGEITEVVRDEKAWKKMTYWPQEFARRQDSQEGDAAEEHQQDNENIEVVDGG